MKMSDGCSLFYRLDGDLAKPVLVFSNPHGFTHRLWDPQVDNLMDRFRILRYDFRGHGGSEIWEGPYSLERAALDVVELVEGLALNKNKVAFCGLSIGGMVGIWLAANKPELLTRVVLANTSLFLEPADHLRRRLALIETSGMGAVVDDIITRSLSEDFRRDNSVTTNLLATMVSRIAPVGYVAGGRVVLQMDLRDCPQHINLPSLVIAGSRDQSTPPYMGEEITKKIAGAQYALLDSAHLSNVEQEAEFNLLLRNFLL